MDGLAWFKAQNSPRMHLQLDKDWHVLVGHENSSERIIGLGWVRLSWVGLGWVVTILAIHPYPNPILLKHANLYPTEGAS